MSKPNILYLHCHDAGRYIQPCGHAVRTPNLQTLAEEGAIFRNAFCCGPTCSPSRAALVTGQYPHVCGMTGLAHLGFALNEYHDHIIHQLHAIDYTSALCGVQHITSEGECKIGYKEVLDSGEKYNDRATAEAAVEWLRQPHEKPFFLSVGFFAPHRAFEAANPEAGFDEDYRFVKAPPVLPDCEATRRDIADFNHAVKQMDQSCGTVLAALQASGLAENTLVIATTDHGIAFPHMKCNLNDHGTGVYLILRGPGGFSGGKCFDSLVTHLDVYPTICDLLEVEPGHIIHGKSLLPLVNGEVAMLHDAVFAEVSYHAAYEPKRTIRTDRYRLVRNFNRKWTKRVLPNCDDSLSKAVLCANGWGEDEIPEIELYDLLNDPTERVNLAGNPALAATRTALESELQKWMEETADPLLQGCVPYHEGMSCTPQTEASPCRTFGRPIM